jgi:hypothetical protein
MSDRNRAANDADTKDRVAGAGADTATVDQNEPGADANPKIGDFGKGSREQTQGGPEKPGRS